MVLAENIYKQSLTESEFRTISDAIYKSCGIKLPYEKKIMVESRLRKRILQLNLSSFKEYVTYVFDGQRFEQELIPMIDLISTNKTDFFREADHFVFLEKTVTDELQSKQSRSKTYKIWSSASSSGEEPYTLAIVFNEIKSRFPYLNFEITASDISTEILKKAINAVYDEEKISELPVSLKQKYFLRSKDRVKKQVRVIPELRNQVKYKRINLIENHYNLDNDYDFIFCRNVLIYFDKETQEKVVTQLLAHLKTGGYLFMGHSETLHSMTLPVKRIESTIYQKL